jgi:hypothetical protein
VLGLTLRVTAARKTPGGKLIADIAVDKEGRRVDVVSVTSTPSSRQAAVKSIAHHVGGADRAQIDVAVGQLLAQALECADRPPVRDGKTLREIVAAVVPAYYQLRYRTARGAWSERKGEITRAEFITHTPAALMAQAEQAIDAPGKDGAVNRPALHRAIETELRILWATLTAPLKAQAEACLGSGSKAASEFRRALVRLWKQTMTFEVAKGTGTGSVTAARSSLAARAASAAAWHLKVKKATIGWGAVQRAFDAYWRVDLVANQPVLRLAMKYPLTFQIGVPLRGSRTNHPWPG